MKGNCDYMIGKRLREEREKLGMSQVILAGMVGVDPAEISQYETGKRKPPLDKFVKIIDVFDVSADFILGREVSVVSEEDEEYKVRRSKAELTMLKELENYPKLYEVLVGDPARSIKVMDKNLGLIYPEKK